jgi:hypothetical protein
VLDPGDLPLGPLPAGRAGARRAGAAFAGARPPPPYSPTGRAELAAIAAAQRDPARRRSALAMVVSGIGAGLRPGELVALRGSGIARRGRQVVVRVAGSRPRLAPLASRYAARATELARCAGDGFVFRPGPADRSCWACLAPPPPSGRSWPPTAGSATASARYSRWPAPGAAEEPAADRRRAQGPHQADDPRPGHRGPGPARGAGQCLAGGQRLGPHHGRTRRLRRLHRPGRHPRAAVSRGPSKRTGLCASDPDGGWYVREGDHREREDKPLRKICWALEATIATTARPPGAPPATPNLAIGMAMARPGEDPGGTGARVLASAAARGHQAGWLGYDRAYTQALPGRFHLPARALGYHPVMDYRDGQLGIQASTGGAILVEGTWYCPALPGPLITAATRLRGHAITRDLYDQQITARTCYQLKRKDGPGADGYRRLSCPAAGKHPGLICPLRQAPLTPRDGRAKVLQPPPEPPRICRQTAITIAPDIGARYRQDLPYGSPAWHKTYATLRNTIEGLNGLVKDPAHEALAQPARRRVRGIAAQSIFTALLLMAANIRKIRA